MRESRSQVSRYIGVWLCALMLTACNLDQGDNTVQTITGVPQVRIASPIPNASFLEGVPVNIQAMISNAGADISRVEIAVDQTIVNTLNAPNTAGAPAFSITQSWTTEGVGSHTITITAFRADGTANDPASVSVTVVTRAGSSSAAEATDEPSVTEPEPTNAPTVTQAPTDTPAPTNSPEPEATSTPSVPMATFLQGVNVRRGPGTNFDPPLGGMAQNDTAEILGVSPDRAWYKIRYYNAEGWVSAPLVSTSGNVANLPVDPGPPTPIPVTPTFTPVPFTATPVTSINLVAGNIRLDPGQPACKETFSISFDIQNAGTTAYNGGGLISFEDTANGATTRTEGAIPAIQPGQTVAVSGIRLTVDTNFETEHNMAAIIDPSGQIAETNEGDNRRDLKYTLKKGSC